MDRTGKLNDRPVAIRCHGVSKIFGQGNAANHVVDNLNIEVYDNEFLVILGPGQCGKTTTLNLIAGLEAATAGTIEVHGETVSEPNPSVGMVYQKTLLFPWLTVRQNVDFGPRMAKVPRQERSSLAQKYIDLVGLTGFEKHFPVKLSGGMAQRVGIARAYCNRPDVILMDEPFGHLDAQTRYMMEAEIERICRNEQKTVVFVTNNVEEAVYLADRIILLSNSPTTVEKEYQVSLARPRDYVDKEFLELRKTITADMESTS